MNFEELSALILMAVAGSFTPGPNTTLSTAIAVNRGLREAMPFVCSVPVGWALMFVLSALGLGTLVVAVPALHTAVMWVGACYMLSLAWKLAEARTLGNADGRQLNIGFWHGVVLQFLNPKGWMLTLSVVAGWVAGKPDVWMRAWVVLGVMFCMALSSNLFYAASGALMRRWLMQGNRLLWFNRFMAVLLGLSAVWVLRQAPV